MDQFAVRPQGFIASHATDLQLTQQELCKKLLEATCQGFVEYAHQLRTEYDMTVMQLSEMLGADAPCRRVDSFTWTTFSALYLLRTGKPPDVDYPMRIIKMMLHT